MDNSEQPFFKRVLDETRKHLDLYRSQNKGFASSYFKCRKPLLGRILNLDRRFDLFYQDQKAIYQNGQVVWGHIIQANAGLYGPGEHNLPAAIIYSLDPEVDQDPDILRAAAQSLFDIKGQETEPELAAFSEKLADEMVADWKLAIPLQVTQGRQCYYTTNMLFRKHMPAGYLAAGLFPVLVAPSLSPVAFMLPSQFWPQIFTDTVWKS